MRPSARLLVIDDDVELCALMKQYLDGEGFVVTAVHAGTEGLNAGLNGEYELIVLDVMLPDIRGFDILRELRLHVRTPVLMLTAKGDEVDRVLGLEMGADDYLAKPFSQRELAARIGAILRRSVWRSAGPNGERPRSIKSGDLELDLAARSAMRSGEHLHLTSAEFDLLHVFLESPGQALDRAVLAERVLGRKLAPFDRSIDLHITNLRRKLGPQPNGEERICSIRGVGYLYAWPR
jgi:two-component system response regulator CpxR